MASPDRSQHACPACGSLVDPLRAGEIAILARGFAYFCSRTCKALFLATPGFEAATADPPRVGPRATANVADLLVDGDATQVRLTPRDVVTPLAPAVAFPLVTPSFEGSEFATPRAATPLPARSQLSSHAQTRPPSPEATSPDLVHDARFARTMPLVAVPGATGAHAAPSIVLPSLGILASFCGLGLHGWAVGANSIRIGFALFAVAMLAIFVFPRLARLSMRNGAIASLFVPGATMLLAAALAVTGGNFEPALGLLLASTLTVLILEVLLAKRSLTLIESSEMHRTAMSGAPHLQLLQRQSLQALVLAVAASAAAATALTGRGWEVVGIILGTASSFALVPLWTLAHAATVEVVLRSLESGAQFTDMRALSIALRTNILVFAGRPGLLCLPATVVAKECLPRRDDETALSKEQLFAVIAGAEEAAPASPLKTSIIAALKGCQHETLRSANYREGAGIVGERSTGERVLVGSRALLLEHHVSTALSETASRQPGTRMIHVGIGKRLAGYFIIEEAPRAQARPAIARLLDARVEPVLISSETREVCETLGAALELEHLRPEIEHSARESEIRLLADAGHTVAAAGHPVHDANILYGAELAFLRPTHDSETLPPNFPATVQLLSDDLRPIATTLTEAKQLAERLKRALLAVFVPALMATLAVTFGIVPLPLAPIGALVGGLLILSPMVFPAQKPPLRAQS